MERTDPRERYDDLVVNSDRHEVDPDRFDELRETEVFQSGRGVAGVVFDAAGRVLAIRNETYRTEWTLPGGAVEQPRPALSQESRSRTTLTPESPRPACSQLSVPPSTATAESPRPAR